MLKRPLQQPRRLPMALCEAHNGRPAAVSPAGPPSSSGRLFSFGIISDVQYADIPNGRSFSGVPRFYRAALPALQRAVAAWRERNVDFGMHFGDIIDGCNPKDKAIESLEAIAAAFDALGRPHWHMIGNHCLYNLSREMLNVRLNMGSPGSASYYSFSPHADWIVVVMDGYDVSLLGWPPGHPLHTQAQAILDAHNPNQEKNSPDGLVGAARRFVKFGGGASKAQLIWLRETLHSAAQRGQRALVCCHLPLYPGTCPGACLLWNYEELLTTLHEADNVVATFAGHAHNDGYALDERGIHHRVLSAVVETPLGRDCYGFIDMYSDRLELLGCDRMASAVMRFKACSGAASGREACATWVEQ